MIFRFVTHRLYSFLLTFSANVTELKTKIWKNIYIEKYYKKIDRKVPYSIEKYTAYIHNIITTLLLQRL